VRVVEQQPERGWLMPRSVGQRLDETKGAAAPGGSARRRAWEAPIVLAATAAVGYANAFQNGFALDDNDVIARNPLAHDLSGAVRAFGRSYWPEITGAGQYRPLTIASFAVDWSLSHGSTLWLHAVNVGWHVVACLLVWRLLATMLTPAAALVGALVFAVHPVHVEAVANLVGRSDVMCAVFVLAALLAHRRGRWWAVPLYAAALASKETGITFLGLAVAADLLPGWRGESPSSAVDDHPGRTARLSARRRALYASYAGVTAVYSVVLVLVFRDVPMVRIAAPWQHSSTVARWLTAVGTTGEYARLMVVPLRLHVDYLPQVIPIATHVTARVLLGALVMIASGALAVRARRRAPALTLAVALFAIAVAPVSNLLFPSGIVVAERTLYLPSVGLAIALGWLWQQGVHTRARRLVPVVAAGAVAACATRTWTRTPVWHDNKTAILASLRDEPESYRAHERAGDVYERAGDIASALREYRVARALYNRDPFLYQAAAWLVVTHEHAVTPAAEQLLDSARLIEPGTYLDLLRHAWLRYAVGDYRGTMALARHAYLLDRDSTGAIRVLAQAAQQIDDVRAAEAAYRLALDDHPRDAALRQEYAALLASIGDTAGARRVGGEAK
jgi:tetratricopeptide (TPR) repeat protein